MKKFFTICLLAMATMMAQAQVKITVNIDDPTHAGPIQLNGVEYTFDETGKIEIDADVPSYGTYLYMNTVAPYTFGNDCSMTAKYTYSDEPQTSPIYGLGYKSSGNTSISSAEWAEWYVINLTTVNLEELRSKTVEVNVTGNAANVSLQSYVTSEFFPLVEGKNTIKFMDEDCPFRISSNDWQSPLYKVSLNGEKQAGNNGYWYVTVADNDVIDIDADFPDEEVTITINFEGEASPATITNYTINNVPVEDPSQPVKAKMGKNLNLTFDTNTYKCEYLKVNGVDQEVSQYYAGYSTTLTEDLDITVKQTLKPVYTAEVTVDEPSRIKYSIQGAPNYPETNVFTVSVTEDVASYTYIAFKPVSADYEIVSVTIDGEPATWDYYEGYKVYLTADGQKINVVTNEVERDKAFAFYFDSPEKAKDGSHNLYGWYMKCEVYDRQFNDDNIAAGYNVVKFAPVDGEFHFEVYGNPEDVQPQSHAYLNNEPLPLTGYDTSWNLTFNDGDVFKLYIGETPTMSTATFKVVGEAVQAIADRINEITVTDGLVIENILPGTEYQFRLPADSKITVNGEELLPVEDPELGNIFTLDVFENVEVVIDDATGISNVKVNAADGAVHNIMGVKVSDNATDNLPAGLYIKNGKKILVK